MGWGGGRVQKSPTTDSERILRVYREKKVQTQRVKDQNDIRLLTLHSYAFKILWKLFSSLNLISTKIFIKSTVRIRIFFKHKFYPPPEGATEAILHMWTKTWLCSLWSHHHRKHRSLALNHPDFQTTQWRQGIAPKHSPPPIESLE